MEFNIVNNRTGNKQIEFVVGGNMQVFYQLASRLQTILSIQYNKKSDSFNTLSWNYQYHGVPFVLRYHWDTGAVLQLENKEPSAEEIDTLDDIISLLKTFS